MPDQCRGAWRLSRADALGPHLADLLGLLGTYLARSSLAGIYALCLGLGDSLKLTFATDVGFKLGKDAKQVEEHSTVRRCRADRLFGCLQSGALVSERMDDLLQIADIARQRVNPGDD